MRTDGTAMWYGWSAIQWSTAQLRAQTMPGLRRKHQVRRPSLYTHTNTDQPINQNIYS